MGTLFFCFIAFLLVGYVVLDGYDLGAGVLHLHLGRTDIERRQVLATIGPLWDGNEVFLVATGGTLFFAFPELYAITFSGFYLPLMIVLWLLMMRGVSVDFRSHLESPLWRQLFDVGFSVASSLLAFLLGVALGNVVRGVPVGEDRTFLQPLWTDLMLGQQTGIVDWYTVIVGFTSLAVLTVQGALWCEHRTEGAVHLRARALVPRLWALSISLVTVMSVITFLIQPRVREAFAGEPWRLVFPVLGFVAMLATILLHRSERGGTAFIAWSAFIALLLASAAFGLYPYVLPSSLDPRWSLTLDQVQAADASLRIGAVWWPIGMTLAVVYTGYVHWRFSGRVPPDTGAAPDGRPVAEKPSP